MSHGPDLKIDQVSCRREVHMRALASMTRRPLLPWRGQSIFSNPTAVLLRQRDRSAGFAKLEEVRERGIGNPVESEHAHLHMTNLSDTCSNATRLTTPRGEC